MIENRKQKNKGFTILETLVAISILLLSITGPMTFAQSGLRAAFVSRDQVTAFFLAQDVIEYVKNVRDNNLIDINNGGTNGWIDGLESCIGDTCTIDTTTATGSIVSCPSAVGCDDTNPLKINNGFFGFDGDSSIFTRVIEIEEIETNQEAEVTVTITWETHGSIGVREIVVRENIFNWLPDSL